MGKDNPLRKYIEEMFPNANGEEVNVIMELLIAAGEAVYEPEDSEE